MGENIPVCNSSYIKVSVYNYEAPLVPIELILKILLDRQKKLLKRENKANSIG